MKYNLVYKLVGGGYVGWDSVNWWQNTCRVRPGARIIATCHTIRNSVAGNVDRECQVPGNIPGNILPEYYQ